MDIVAPLITDRHSLRYFATHAIASALPPTCADPKLLAALYLLPGYAPLDAALLERPRALFVVVVGFVGVQSFSGRFLGACRGDASYRLDRIQQLLEDHRVVVDVGGTRR